MSRRILFSPVGGTDPISAANWYDGSLLHICRYYRPDVVYLYMSGEILEKEKEDDRYMYCLRRLDEMQDRKTQYIRIERPDLKNVEEYDFFYQEFREIMLKIEAEKEPEDELFLNIASGTPAMKSSLLVLKTLGEFPCKAIQVVTPVRGMNEHLHKNYDVETLWEMNCTLEAEGENRCREVNCPTLSVIKQENAIRELLSRYDYPGALAVARLLPEEDTKSYMNLLKMAERRILLDGSGVDKCLIGDDRYRLPVRDGRERKYFEYALSIQIRLQREEYADFIRALTPIFTVIYERILANHTSIRLEDYCKPKKEKNSGYKNGSYKAQKEEEEGYSWDPGKLRGTEVNTVLGGDLNGKQGYVTNYHYAVLIEHFCKEPSVVEVMLKIREIEKEIRNETSHEIVCVTAEDVQRKTGFTGNQIMQLLRRALNYAGFHFTQESWNSYDEMNGVILKAMEQAHM